MKTNKLQGFIPMVDDRLIAGKSGEQHIVHYLTRENAPSVWREAGMGEYLAMNSWALALKRTVDFDPLDGEPAHISRRYFNLNGPAVVIVSSTPDDSKLNSVSIFRTNQKELLEQGADPRKVRDFLHLAQRKGLPGESLSRIPINLITGAAHRFYLAVKDNSMEGGFAKTVMEDPEMFHSSLEEAKEAVAAIADGENIMISYVVEVMPHPNDEYARSWRVHELYNRDVPKACADVGSW